MASEELFRGKIVVEGDTRGAEASINNLNKGVQSFQRMAGQIGALGAAITSVVSLGSQLSDMFLGINEDFEKFDRNLDWSRPRDNVKSLQKELERLNSIIAYNSDTTEVWYKRWLSIYNTLGSGIKERIKEINAELQTANADANAQAVKKRRDDEVAEAKRIQDQKDQLVLQGLDQRKQIEFRAELDIANYRNKLDANSTEKAKQQTEELVRLRKELMLKALREYDEAQREVHQNNMNRLMTQRIAFNRAQGGQTELSSLLIEARRIGQFLRQSNPYVP